jgi:hypothetical protein
MGAIASHISNQAFNFQDGGENPNKNRIIRVYNNYVEQAAKQAKEGGLKINVFDFISSEVTDDDKEIGKVIASFGKTWPPVEGELTSADGFFNSLTELEAEKLSMHLEGFLPKFESQAV